MCFMCIQIGSEAEQPPCRDLRCTYLFEGFFGLLFDRDLVITLDYLAQHPMSGKAGGRGPGANGQQGDLDPATGQMQAPRLR